MMTEAARLIVMYDDILADAGMSVDADWRTAGSMSKRWQILLHPDKCRGGPSRADSLGYFVWADTTYTYILPSEVEYR